MSDQPQPVVVQAEPLLVGARDAARLLGLKQRSFERRLACGDLPAATVRIGRRRLWAMDDLRSWVRAGCRSIECSEGNGEGRP